MFTVNSNPKGLEKYSVANEIILKEPFVEDTRRQLCLYDFAAKDDSVFIGYSNAQDSGFAREILNYCFNL